MLAEGLNEYARLHWAGRAVPNHWPSSPRYWFQGIVQESGWKEPPESVREALTPGALRLWRAITREWPT